MNKLLLIIFFTFSSAVIYETNAQTVIITQVDTFAIRALPDQPVLKIVINTGSNSNLSLEKLVIYSAGEDSLDVDRVKLYKTRYDRFSKSEYAEEVSPITANGVKFIKDSAVFSGLTYPLNVGENIFWVVYDLSQQSKAGHFLDGFIKTGGIIISGVKYPSSIIDPAGDILIRQKYFVDNFEKFGDNKKPLNWTISGDVNADWKCYTGGYAENPSSAKSGILNARSYAENPSGRVSRMISKPLNFSLAIKPRLTFYHAQMYRPITDKSDSLGIYYGFSSVGPWNFIKNYTLPTPDGVWVKREIDLPEEIIKDNVFLVFKSTAQWGFGVCVDSLTIYEANVSERKVKAVVCHHPNLNLVPQGSSNNPILRFNIGVTGNTGSLNFSSVKITSLNSSDNDISNVLLYYTNDSVFVDPKLVGTGVFSSGVINFSGFNRKLESGDNYYWVTYDVKSNATPENFIDAKIAVGDILISDGDIYPATELSPVGRRTIKQSVFFDDFENEKGWLLSGEFERGKPQGKGGVSYGFKDPSIAFSLLNVMGTDLGNNLSNGDYSKNSRDIATTPLIHSRYFKNTIFSFARWLNAENQDSAVIEYQYEGETRWHILWETSSNIIEGSWNQFSVSTRDIFDRRNFRIRFRLGTTNVLEEYSGWNIDDVFITGDSIKYDAAVSEYMGPFSACGLSAGEQVKVKVKNTGPKLLSNIPIKLSLDGGKTWISETVSGNLEIDNSVVHSFQPVNLSKPSVYNIIVKVAYKDDNYKDNDSVFYKITSVPTHTPPFTDGFEKDTTFWQVGGLNPSWTNGKPSGIGFNSAYEGAKCWKTDIHSGYHSIYENSYIESPCFNFSDTEVPVVDMFYRYYTQMGKSGARLEYSLDGGITYQFVPEDSYDFNWNWYNDSLKIFNDKKKGWTYQSLNGTELTWVNGKQMLPIETANHNLVRFRVHFKADSSLITPDPGFAFDYFKVLNAPQDAGVISIDELTSPACQFANSDKLKITIQNFGLRKIRQNDSIVIGIKVNNNAVVKDTFKLTSDLNVNEIRQFTMKKPVNFVDPGNYLIKAFVIEKYTDYYNTNNDTSQLDITVYTNPITNLPDTILTARRDTLIVNSKFDPEYKYEWVYENSLVSDTYQLNASTTGFGEHILTVEDQISGCTTKDTLYIKSLIPDVGVQSIISPKTGCGNKSPVRPIIRIKNYGTDTLRINRTIPVKIKLNKETIISEIITLKKVFAPDSIFDVVLNSSLNLSNPQIDTLKIWTNLAGDDTLKNDTAKHIFQIYGYPKVFLGNDTIIYGKLTHELNVGSGFNSVLWSDGITSSQKFTVSKSGKYFVTVTDINNCSNSDTIKLHLKIHDLMMQKLTSPANACSQTSTTSIQCQLKNSGTDTIETTEPIILFYQVDNGSMQKDTIYLSTMLKPNDSINHVFRKTFDMTLPKSYSFKLKSFVSGDIQPLNDSIIQLVNVFGNPNLNLGDNRIIKELSYSICPGRFASYKWQDNSMDTAWTITKTKFMPDNKYSVTVTDNNGCSSTDEVILFLLINDLQVSDILLERSSCSMSKNELINLKVTNNGNAPLSNIIVEAAYSLNGKPEVKENFIFNGNVGASMVHTFSTAVDMSAKGVYSFKARVSMPADADKLNDTATVVSNVLGYPEVGFNFDTIKVRLPYKLSAKPGYAEYLWQDNSTDSTLTITSETYDPENPIYTVKVTDENNCTVSDNVKVIEARYDLAISGINKPHQNCILEPGKLSVTIRNNSTISISNQNVTLGYALDGAVEKTKQFSIDIAKGASQTFEFDEDVNMSAKGIHILNLSLFYAEDENITDNFHSYEVKVNGIPEFSFPVDTVKTSSFPYIINAGDGFASYKWNDNSTEQVLNVTSEGKYSVMVTDANNCSAKDSVYVLHSTGTNFLKEDARISVYPNPVSNYLYVTINLDKKQSIMMDIISAEGKVVYNKKFENMNEYREDIDVSGLPKGLYYVRFYADDSMVVQKIVVK